MIENIKNLTAQVNQNVRIGNIPIDNPIGLSILVISFTVCATKMLDKLKKTGFDMSMNFEEKTVHFTKSALA